MSQKECRRRIFSWCMVLVMLAGMTALPALAAEGGESAPASVEAPAAVEAPASVEAPAPAEAPTAAEAPADTGEAATVQAEAPAVSDAETPVEQAETPAVSDAETPVEQAETPVFDDETPVEQAETPVVESAPSVQTSSAPAASSAPAISVAPAASAAPAAQPEEEAEAAFTGVSNAALFSSSSLAAANGFVIDWSAQEVQDAGWAGQLGAVEADGGYYVYLVTDEYLSAYAEIATPGEWYNPVAMTLNCNPWSDPGAAVDGSGNAIVGSQVHYYYEGSSRYTEIFVPASTLPASEQGYIIQAGSASFAFTGAPAPADAGDEADPSAEPEPTPEPVYGGIVIDGDFADWAAVPRYDVVDYDINGVAKTYDTVDQISVVWDGDWVYVLLVAEGDRDWQGELTGQGNWNSVTGAGTHNNGQFAITTDLGRTMLIQPTVNSSGEPAVAGVDGAKAAVNNKEWMGAPHMWELAIPAGELPEYLETISFGFYLSEPSITDLSNMQGGGGVDPFGANVVIDGKYDDWVGYPHSLIQYDHEGIQYSQVDGEGALWSSDGVLYGHVVTEHPDHLAELGSEFLAAISIAFNGDREFKDTPDKGNFYPRILAIDADGTVTDYYTTVNEGHSTPNGTYTYYIFDIRTDPVKQFGHTDENGVWHDATAADLAANAFGTMKVTVTGVKDDMEFDLDLRKVADYIGADASDFKTIEAQFGRIGQQWITTAGTPTGPILGVALAVGAVGAPVCYVELKKRRAAKKAVDSGEGR